MGAGVGGGGLRPKKKKRKNEKEKKIVWLSSTTFFEKGQAGGRIPYFLDYFFQIKVKAIIASISPNKGANKSTLSKISLYKFKYNFKTSIKM